MSPLHVSIVCNSIQCLMLVTKHDLLIGITAMCLGGCGGPVGIATLSALHSRIPVGDEIFRTRSNLCIESLSLRIKRPWSGVYQPLLSLRIKRPWSGVYQPLPSNNDTMYGQAPVSTSRLCFHDVL